VTQGEEGALRYEYRFVTVEGAPRRHLTDRPHRRIIEEHAADGWRLVQVLPEPGRRRPATMELIFERAAEARDGSGDDYPAAPI
jgi:hypothetical protein